jgi:Flp pilus assembly protein TadD
MGKMEHHDFEIALARSLLAKNPDRVDALEMLADALAQANRYAEALEFDLRLTRLKPEDPSAQYNLACTQSSLGDVDRAFQALERAFELGYHDYKRMLRDRELENVRRDPRWRRFLTKRWGKRRSSR